MKDATKPNGLNYIAFECEIEMKTLDDRRFSFENQPYRARKEILSFLKRRYTDWTSSKIFESRNHIKPTLPKNVAKILKTNDSNYVRDFIVIDIIIKNC